MATRLLSAAVRPLVSTPGFSNVARQNGHRVSTRCLWVPTASALGTEASTPFTNLHLNAKFLVHQLLRPFRLPVAATIYPSQISKTAVTTEIARSTFPSSTTFFSSSLQHSRSGFLNKLLSKFSSTRPSFALRNTYYSRTRDVAPRSRGGGFGGQSGGGRGLGVWQRIKSFINALPSNVLVWTIIAANGLVFLGWQYAGSLFVRL